MDAAPNDPVVVADALISPFQGLPAGTKIPNIKFQGVDPVQFAGSLPYTYPKLVMGGTGKTDAFIPDDQMDHVQHIDLQVNHDLIPDDSLRDHPWRVLQPGDRASCHDFALTKMQQLLDAGYPRDAMSLNAVKDHDGHMVLAVRFKSGVRLLDNLKPDMQPADNSPYDWEAHESWGDPTTWVGGAP